MNNDKKPTVVPIHSIKLDSETEFAQRFNYVSDLFSKWQSLPDGEEKQAAWNEYFEAKYALEQGLPIVLPTQPTAVEVSGEKKPAFSLEPTKDKVFSLEPTKYPEQLSAEEVKRPCIKDYFEEGASVFKAHSAYVSSPELFQYAQALDRYIDELESQLRNEPKGEGMKDLIIHGMEEGMQEWESKCADLEKRIRNSDLFFVHLLEEIGKADWQYESCYWTKPENGRSLKMIKKTSEELFNMFRNRPNGAVCDATGGDSSAESMAHKIWRELSANNFADMPAIIQRGLEEYVTHLRNEPKGEVRDFKTTFKFYRNDDAPYVGAYRVGTMTNGEPTIMFNMDFEFQLLKDVPIGERASQVQDGMLQTLTHEFCHALQEWLGKEFDELEVEKILGAYNEKWNVFQAEEPEDTPQPSFRISDFLEWMNSVDANSAEDFKAAVNDLFMAHRLWIEAEQKANKEQNDAGCDTTKADQGIEAGNQKVK